MLRFEWSAYVTPELVARVAAAAGVTEAVVAECRPLLEKILGRTGGLPFVATEPTAADRTSRGLLLLAEAATHALAEAGATQNAFGYVTSPGVEPLYGKRVSAQLKINVNSASAGELAALPGLTRALVDEILDERGRSGRFANLEELARRVKGVGPVKAAAVGHAVVFDDGRDPRRPTLAERGGLDANLGSLVALQPDVERPMALRRALEMILTSCSSHPHPATRDHTIREPQPAEAGTPHAAAWVGELWSDDYWKDLPAVMGSAAKTIDVCMFHIAAPNPQHPTYVLIDALRKAHQRGVGVRVLLDRDGKMDPYHSTVINSAARRFFEDAGVPCRSDASNRLLHSKYLIIDANLVVIGSHNWSAGSYFGFDDLSLAVSSADFAAELGRRFDTQWSAAH